MRFTYGSGQRVLDGYTVKRGIGKGGFGEVFYAISDGGKEVALKLVRGDNMDVELRGMAHCLNLKHTNLLPLYDLRTDTHGDHWVIMEYIGGEALSAILNRHPNGLPVETAREWFLGLARAIIYLHDHGIVHRDLKPANIFLENGIVKVGDYGLCKFISSSQRSAQTQSVGTVHYMAPEISTGNYNKQIDIYAAGVILYEMLTGHVPFEGETTGEILMKHLTSPPDLTKLPHEYVLPVDKALAKNPVQRYQTMSEMARVVEGIGERGRVSAPSSVQGARPHAPTNGQASPRFEQPAAAIPRPAPAVPIPLSTHHSPLTTPALIGELCGSLALTALFALLAFILIAQLGSVEELSDIGAGFFVTVATCWAVLIPAKFWNEYRGDSGWRRVAMMALGALVGLGAFWLDGWTLNWSSAEWRWTPPDQSAAGWQLFGYRGGIPLVAGYLSYFALTMFAVRWWKLAERQRSHRFSLAPVFAAAFWAFVLLVLCPGQLMPRGPLPVILAAVLVQLVSPWEPAQPAAAKRMRLRLV
jgi:hypothetical protein